MCVVVNNYLDFQPLFSNVVLLQIFAEAVVAKKREWADFVRMQKEAHVKHIEEARTRQREELASIKQEVEFTGSWATIYTVDTIHKTYTI